MSCKSCFGMFHSCCFLLALPEIVLWGAGLACCAGAVSDQCAKFDATLSWESEAKPSSANCLETDSEKEETTSRWLGSSRCSSCWWMSSLVLLSASSRRIACAALSACGVCSGAGRLSRELRALCQVHPERKNQGRVEDFSGASRKGQQPQCARCSGSGST